MSSQAHTRTLRPEDAISGTFSALHFLRSYSLLAPPTELCRYDPYHSIDYGLRETEVLQNNITREGASSPLPPTSISAAFPLPASLLQPPLLASMPPLIQPVHIPQTFSHSNSAGALMSRHLIGSGITNLHQRRPRSEKKPIPEEQKDEKYFEKRKRNNQAAKKSRDARKIREDHIALRATMLEHENAILRAQIVNLRDEAQSLRHMLMKQQTSGLQAIERIRPISEIPIAVSPSRLVTSLACQV